MIWHPQPKLGSAPLGSRWESADLSKSVLNTKSQARALSTRLRFYLLKGAHACITAGLILQALPDFMYTLGPFRSAEAVQKCWNDYPRLG